MSGAADRRAEKAALRRRAKAARAHARKAAPDAAGRAASRFLDAVAVAPGMIVSGYRPIQDEIDPTPLLNALSARGARLCLPVIEGPDAPLRFRAWSPGAALTSGAFGAEVPCEGEMLAPAMLILPLLAFDRSGARLGYGGGYFDRTLAALREEGPARAVGLAYAGQEMAGLPQEPTDQPLDALATENEVIFFGA